MDKMVNADILIVGGGLAGVLTAYLLGQSKKKVTLLEKGEVGSGATAATTAHITQVIDTQLSDLVSIYGQAKAKLVWQSGQKAIDLIEQIVKKEKIKCDFKRCSGYCWANSDSDMESYEKDYKWAKKLGFRTRLSHANDLGFENCGYLEVKNQAKFSAEEFLKALAQKARKNGVEILEKTEAQKLSKKGNLQVVKTTKGDFAAPTVIVATYDPFVKFKEIFAKKGMYKSYVLTADIPKGRIKEGLYWDIEEPYHYFRIDPKDKKSDSIMLGGEDHRTEIKVSESKSYKALEDYLKEILPGVKYKVDSKWAGPILEPTDGLALIGRVKPGILVATAFSGNGMTNSAISAMIFRDIVLKKKNPWVTLYNPKRKLKPKALLEKGKDYIKTFLNAAVRNTFKYS